jgi:hypothetical protein
VQGRFERGHSMFSSTWDQRFMMLAHQIAHWSKESGRRVGAVIVGPDKEIRSTGFNGFPRGVRDDIPERHSRETGAKYLWSSHAERNAIYNAARIGVSVKGCVMYVPWYPASIAPRRSSNPAFAKWSPTRPISPIASGARNSRSPRKCSRRPASMYARFHGSRICRSENETRPTSCPHRWAQPGNQVCPVRAYRIALVPAMTAKCRAG